MRTVRGHLHHLLTIGALNAVGAIGCSADPAPVIGPAAAMTVAQVASAAPAQTAAQSAPEYVLADLTRRNAATMVPISRGQSGVLIDGARAIVSESGVTFASEIADRALSRVDVVPARLGGGFLFRTNDALYTSATFDGPLRPVVSFPEVMNNVAFGTDSVLVRGAGGERWLIDLATGARKILPLMGLVTLRALEDGRAIAVTEAGGLSITTNGGKTWRDARGDLRGTPGEPFIAEDELWIADRLANAERPLRLERSGALVEMGALPPSTPPAPKTDPRFPGSDSPLRYAMRFGVRAGPWSAVIGAGGDVLRVDLTSGAITSTIAGVLPSRMTCQAVEIPDDVALVCTERGRASVVVTKVLHGKEPRVERSFPTDGPFYATEDGALAYGGPCGPPENDDKPVASAPLKGASSSAAPVAPPPPLPTVCARNPEGQWEPFVLDPEAGKVRGAGKNAKSADDSDNDPTAPASKGTAKPMPSSAPTASPKYKLSDIRWVPRLGRPPIALIGSVDLASYDPAWGEIRMWKTAFADRDLLSALRRHVDPKHDAPIVDQRWTASPQGAVEAMLDDGRTVEVSPAGAINVYPFTFERAAIAGHLAFAKGTGGRAFQTLDRGHTWSEIAAPPSVSAPNFDPRACSALGCDLGQWLRVGWSASLPQAAPETKKIARPAAVPVTPMQKISCLTTGHVNARMIQATLDDAFDVGLGVTRLPRPALDPITQWETRAFGRNPVNIPQGTYNVAIETAPRAFQSGYAPAILPPEREDQIHGLLGTLGPSRAASAFRPEIAFVEPLVPSAPIRRATYGYDAIGKALKGSGISVEELVESGNLELMAMVPITPTPSKGKAAATGELLGTFAPTTFGTLYIVLRGGASPRSEMLFTRRFATAQSAARLPNGDLVALVVDESNGESLLRFASTGVTELASLPSPPYYGATPPNPDIVAVNAKGDVAVLRTPSGFEPASANDPALLILPGPRVQALAPWSAAVSAGDASCATSPDDMYRATLQTAASWYSVAGRAEFDGAMSGMTARVRWSPTKLCVEALDVPERPGTSPSYRSTETIITATFSPDDAGRNEIELGAESRESMSCALTP